MFSAARKIRLRSSIINNMSSTALISCRMKIDLYLLNCYPLNPSIPQTMSFVNSTCLKISKIIFCFTTVRWKNEGNIFTSLKDVTSFNAQYCACIFVCLFFLFFLWLLLVYMFLHGDLLFVWFKFSSFSFSAKHSHPQNPFSSLSRTCYTLP